MGDKSFDMIDLREFEDKRILTQLYNSVKVCKLVKNDLEVF